MKCIPTCIGCICVICTVLLLNSCKNSKVSGEIAKEIAGKAAEGAASAVVTNFFTQSKSEAKPSDQNLISLKADQSLVAEAKIAEIKEAINFANEAEAQAYRNLNPNLLERAYTGKALQLRQALVNGLAEQKVYQVETLYDQQFYDFKISSDDAIAEVEMAEKWSGEIYSSETNTLVGQFPLHDVPQTIYLQKDLSGWRISAIVFQGGLPEFIPAQQFQSPPPQSTTNFYIRDNLGTDQVSEQLTMMIDGKIVGTLAVNQNYPESSLTVTVPNPGRYPFKADARAVFNDGIERTCAGEGEVDVSDGKSFSAVANLGNNVCYLSFRED